MIPREDRPLVFDDPQRQRVQFTTCYMCACRCGIKVTLEGDRVRFIQGNSNHPVNQGVLCAKGSAGIQKQYSPAKLRQPLLRKPGTERGEGQFEAISWERALDLLTERLQRIRSTDPKQLAFFTGRDQMQALTGLWAQQFGTPNWAAHGGFCSVNIAAAGLYSIGYSFWEFGAPDWDHAKYFVLWGVAEDHASNPIKIGLDKLKRRGAKFVSINPVRTGYSAIADQWIPIRPGTDGLLAFAVLHVLLSRDLVDWEFLVRYTNAPWLVIQSPGSADDGLFVRDAAGNPQVWDQGSQSMKSGMEPEIAPAVIGEFSLAGGQCTPASGQSTLAGGRKAKTVMTLLAERFLDPQYAPQAVAERCGVTADVIERMALEMAHVAFKETIELPIRWTDVYGRVHDKVIGRPVAMYAMRGVSAHTNGFHTCRALHLIQMLLGALEGPGNFRSRAPFPRPIPPAQLPENDLATINAADTPLGKPPLGFPTRPEDLCIDPQGRPLRIDHAYSWESPIAAHGAMHMVITNAVNANPYPIDTLLLFMANMAWNSTMNTSQVQDMLRARDERGEYKLPFLVVVDAFHSETVNFADLVLPDTTYLERFDAISLLDRPISEPDAIADAIRHPILTPDRDVRPWQDVLVELGVRLKFPVFTHPDGSRKFADYKTFIAGYERAPGIGFLAGWRGANGEKSLRGEPNPKQWERYIENEAFFTHHWADNEKYYRFANRDYLTRAVEFGFIPKVEPIVLQLYSEPLQKFRLAGLGQYAGPKPTEAIDRERLTTFFDPLPIWYAPFEQTGHDAQRASIDTAYPFHAITQRPMIMYHSWDSQNSWLRQLIGQNFLYMNAARARELGLADLDWVWVESHNGRIRCQLKTMEGVERNTVWTWNAIGKQPGAWGLTPQAPEATSGFLLNHLITEHLPRDGQDRRIANSDPVTGQAAWYDLRVRITKAQPGETGTWPQFPSIRALP